MAPTTTSARGHPSSHPRRPSSSSPPPASPRCTTPLLLLLWAASTVSLAALSRGEAPLLPAADAPARSSGGVFFEGGGGASFAGGDASPTVASVSSRSAPALAAAKAQLSASDAGESVGSAPVEPLIIRDAYVDAEFPLSAGVIERASAAVESAVRVAGGLVESSSTSTDVWLLQRHAAQPAAATPTRTTTTTHSSLSVRVPVASLDAARDAVRAAVVALGGTVGSESSNSRDATGEFVDATARAETAAASRAALAGLLAAAVSVSDVLAVTRELNDLTAREESARATMQWLSGRAAMAAFSISLRVGEPPQPTPTPRPTPTPWSIPDTAARAVGSLGNTGRALVDFLIFAAVFSVPGGLCVLAVAAAAARVPALHALAATFTARLGGGSARAPLAA